MTQPETENKNWKLELVLSLVKLITFFAPHASKNLKINYFHTGMLCLVSAFIIWIMLPGIHDIPGIDPLIASLVRLGLTLYLIFNAILELKQCTQQIFRKDVGLTPKRAG